MEKSNKTETANQVVDLGRIARFQLPAGWMEKSAQQEVWAQQSYSRDFSPTGDSNACLSVYFRGFLISEASGQRFSTLLRQLPHQLLREEINSITQVLNKIADEEAFEIRNIATTLINGTKVLIIDGEWKTSKTQFQGLMIAVDESGREVQEIFFEAPQDSFVKYLNEVVESIRKIEWKGL